MRETLIAESRCNQIATFPSAEASKSMQRSRHLLYKEHKKSFSVGSHIVSRRGNNNRNELENWGRKKKDEKQSAIKINIGNFVMLSCVVHFSLFFYFNLVACTIFYRLLYLAQLRKNRKQKRVISLVMAVSVCLWWSLISLRCGGKNVYSNCYHEHVCNSSSSSNDS